VEISDCVFLDNAGSGILRWNVSLDLAGCSVVGNGGAAEIVDWSSYVQPPLNIDRCIFAFRPAGDVLLEEDYPAALQVSCTDIFGNADGDWTGPLAPFSGVNGNFSADPQFCDRPAGDLTLYDTSPCLPENNDCSVLIGAEGEGCTDPTAVPATSALAARFERNYPNPFNPTTRLVFELNEAGPVSLSVHDAAGRLVAMLLNGEVCSAGRHVIDWQGRDDSGATLASGVYFAQLNCAGMKDRLKMTLIR
jgi:hypothetical protein